jgi:hypothetical protein
VLLQQVHEGVVLVPGQVVQEQFFPQPAFHSAQQSLHDVESGFPLDSSGDPGLLQQQYLDAGGGDDAALVKIQTEYLREASRIRVHHGPAVAETLQDRPESAQLFHGQDFVDAARCGHQVLDAVAEIRCFSGTGTAEED